nr:uncharacterized protein K02A2.6-like [Lepeophtheirus salmonis]
MDGELIKILSKDGYISHVIHSARPIPFACRGEVKKEIDHMEKMGVIGKVGDKAIEWCHPLVVVPKPNGKVRLCVDLLKLNDQVYRSIHPMRTPRDIILSLPTEGKFFMTMDTKQGYCQMELAEKSGHMTGL